MHSFAYMKSHCIIIHLSRIDWVIFDPSRVIYMFIMTKTLLVFFIMFATLIKMPMAIPYIHTRQEIWGNIEWGGLIENTINTLGTLGTGVGNFFQDPNLSDSSAIQKKQGAGPLNELDIENNPPQAPSDVPIGGLGFTGTGLAGGDDCDPTQVSTRCSGNFR